MNNQPAFPIADPFSIKCPSTEEDALRLRNGMTLRDYFAAKAMQAYLTHEQAANQVVDIVAGWSYEMADAMLEARSQNNA